MADTHLTFVSEPEAAALATLKRVDGRCDIEDGDCFVVCDCGGGTVDLVSYAVRSTEPMVVRESVKGTGMQQDLISEMSLYSTNEIKVVCMARFSSPIDSCNFSKSSSVRSRP